MGQDIINRCQYWSTNESYPCEYWDLSTTTCEYVSINSDLDSTKIFKSPELAPYCNLIGTAVSCNYYKSTNPGKLSPRCILPDPRRHVCNRYTGEKWVTGTAGSWNFNDITGYNNGTCDSNGTATTCSGYSPYHLGFGVLKPSKDEDLFDTFVEGRYSTTEEFGYRLPTNFVIYNIRGILSRCYWWKTDVSNFVVNSSTGKVELSGGWNCSCPDDTSDYSEFTLDNGPPCNGCKPECNNYIGVCWKYCIDAKMETGDPILAEQIHELRYYHREHNWTVENIQSLFIDEGDIFTWSGVQIPALKGNITTTVGQSDFVEEYNVPAVKVTMPTFNEFTVSVEDVILTQGTTVTKTLKDYPTLIRQVQQLPLSPIIRTEFTKHIDGNDYETYLFETPHLKEDTNVSIYGKVFHSTPVYALNLSDKQLKAILPHELYYFDNVYDIEEKLGKENYDIFNTKLTDILRIILKISPEKIFYNTLPNEDRTFLIDVPALNGCNTFNGSNTNTVIIFQESNNYFTYDKITFVKRIVGGVLFQKEFIIEGNGVDITPPIPDYEKSFMAAFNTNGSMSFSFSPFTSEGIITNSKYIYNDSVHTDPISGDTYLGYKLYKITIPNYILGSSTTLSSGREFKQIGSNGYMLITLSNIEIHNAVKPLEIETITVTYERYQVTLDDKIQTVYAECEMEIVIHGADGTLAQNQLIVKPKAMIDFAALCPATVVLKNLVYWEKRSFGQKPTPTLGTVKEISIGNATSVLDVGDFNGSPDEFRIENYKFAMVPSVVMSDSTGRPFLQSRTKPLGMVKQAACPDIEIFYQWSAKYTQYQNHPVCAHCCGQAQELWLKSGIVHTNLPMCGDHFECAGCYPAAVWWPYNRCQSYKSYSQVTNLDNWDLEMLGLFQMKDGDDWVHGSHDMRMLCPHKRYATTGTYCPPRWCYCIMESFNSYITGEPYFTGYARVRAGVSTYQLTLWYATGSDPVMQFGNERRSVLRTYRTIDTAPFIRTDINPESGLQEKRTDWKLMPATQMFSKSDITSYEDEMWNYFCSSDGPNVINPLGFFLANEFDGISINESIDIDNRFRFEEIITCKVATDLGYPKTVGDYVVSTGSTVSPWYEFKQYKDSNNYIQWAWQEPWKTLKRNYSFSESKDYNKYITTLLDSSIIKSPFMEVDLDVQGYFTCISATQPMYEYDWENREFRLTPAENEDAIIKFFAPSEKDIYTGEYKGYPRIQLNNGPKRGINWAGEWLTEENADGILGKGESYKKDYNTELYYNCIYNLDNVKHTGDSNDTVTMWSDKVTLFDTGYEDQEEEIAKSENRMVWTFEAIGGGLVQSTKTYFQRGLSVLPIIDKMGELPLCFYSISPEEYKEIDGPKLALCGTSADTQQFGFDFDRKNKTIGRFTFTYNFGSKLVVDDSKIKVYKYYHMPQVSVYSSSDGLNIEKLLYETSGMELYNGSKKDNPEIFTKTLEWVNMLDYIGKGAFGLVIILRTTPTDDEVIDSEILGGIVGRYESSSNFVDVGSTDFFEETLINATEPIAYWERKYNVSYGTSGDCPPQGRDGASVLAPIPDNKSTCWQIDSTDGVNGIPDSSGEMVFMSKVRGRFVFDIYKDNHVLVGSVPDMENLQKKLYDQAVDKASSVSTMKPVLNPGLQQLLKDNNVTFIGPKSSLVLKNTLVSKLAKINQFDTMSAEGHSYVAQPYSSDLGCPGDCMKGDAFTFAYTNFDGDYDTDIMPSSHEAPDVLHQFYWGTLWMMQRRDTDIELRTNVFPEIYGRNTSNRIFTEDPETLKSNLFYPELGPKPTGSMSGNIYVPKRSNPIVPFYWGGMWGVSMEPIYPDF